MAAPPDGFMLGSCGLDGEATKGSRRAGSKRQARVSVPRLRLRRPSHQRAPTLSDLRRDAVARRDRARGVAVGLAEACRHGRPDAV